MINGTVLCDKPFFKREVWVTGREMEIIVPIIERGLKILLKQRQPEKLFEATQLFKVWWRGTHPRVGRPSYPKPIDWDTIEKYINQNSEEASLVD